MIEGRRTAPHAQRADPVRLVAACVTTAAALPLAAFFGFVGFMKTVSPLAELAKHGAWTVALPEWLGRVVGVSEMACALGLVAALSLRGRVRWLPAIAGVLVANQLCAATVHAARDEIGALPQNGVLIALLLIASLAARIWLRRARR